MVRVMLSTEEDGELTEKIYEEIQRRRTERQKLWEASVKIATDHNRKMHKGDEKNRKLGRFLVLTLSFVFLCLTIYFSPFRH